MAFRSDQNCPMTFEVCMPYIALIVEDLGPDKACTISELRTVSAVGVTEIVKAVAERRPIFEKKLFDRSDQSFPERLLHLLQRLESLGLPYHAYQVLDDDIFDPARRAKYYEVTAHRLQNIIEARCASLEQQRRLARLEEGVEE